MLVFSEGVPRSGKSYDAVKNHILPALTAGRRVYARLNGLNHERIAEYLKLPLERVQELLIHVPTDQVRSTFVAFQVYPEVVSDYPVDSDASGQWVIDDKFKNALVVIDEVHEFYIGGTREPLPPAIEQFFALHGHYGMDVLTMTQFYKRVHTAIRYRIERKNTFQKLSALGSKGESLYRETAYQTVAPDKFEKVAASTKKYDAKIFPLYHGIVGGTDSDVQQDVYSGGRVSVWKALGWRAAIIIPAGIFSIWFLIHFFTSGGASIVKSDKMRIGQPRSIGVDQGEPIPGNAPAPAAARAPAPGAPAAPAQPLPPPDPLANMTPEQRYVWELSKSARIRYIGSMGSTSGFAAGVLEWLDSSEVTKDRLTLDQVRALGVDVTEQPYGVRLEAAGQVLVATAWPRNAPIRDVAPRLYDTSGGRPGLSDSEALAPSAVAASEASAAPAGGTDVVAHYGGFRQ